MGGIREAFGNHFGESAAEIEPVKAIAGPRFGREQAQFDEFGSGPAQGFEIFLIIEPQAASRTKPMVTGVTDGRPELIDAEAGGFLVLAWFRRARGSMPEDALSADTRSLRGCVVSPGAMNVFPGSVSSAVASAL